MRFVTFWVRLFFTWLRVWCWLRGKHLYNEWPDVLVEGQRQRPYRMCSYCGTVALVQRGREILKGVKLASLGSKQDPEIRKMFWRPFWASLPGRNGLP